MQRMLKALLLFFSFGLATYGALYVRVIDWNSARSKRVPFGVTYEGRPFSGITYQWTKGRLTKLAFHLHGKRHGGEWQWNIDGQILIERHYHWGQEDGEQLSWYPDGKPRTFKYFSKGKLEGEAYEWHSTGSLAQVVSYRNGEEWGAKSFTAGGKPFYNYVWHDEKRIGLSGDRFCSVRR